jgi:hypothetical protein
VSLVILGAAAPERVEEAVAAFEAAGFKRLESLGPSGLPDAVLGVGGGGSELLREADRRGIKYVLVHDGPSDGQTGGTYERAHHRIDAPQRAPLAKHLRSRERQLVTCLAFGYKNGVPPDAGLLIDARFLDNPYWVPELRDRSGRDAAVVEYVMAQPQARRLLDDMQRIVHDLLPLYEERGHMHVVVAFGCTGGQHRSVVLAAQLAERLKDAEKDVDVEFVTRDID